MLKGFKISPFGRNDKIVILLYSSLIMTEFFFSVISNDRQAGEIYIKISHIR